MCLAYLVSLNASLVECKEVPVTIIFVTPEKLVFVNFDFKPELLYL